MARYSEKLRDPRWQRKRLEILKRDDFTCQDCDSKDKTLHVHHCHYDGADPWDADDRFLLTLCEECHEQREELEHDLKRAIGFLLGRIRGKNGEDTLPMFVESAIRLIDQANEIPCPQILDSLELEHLSDIRWYQYAWDNADGRKMYQEVTGFKIGKWQE